MSNSKYPACEALDPCFEIMMKGLSKYVDGEHYFDTLADDVVFEFLYEFPGWPRVSRGHPYARHFSSKVRVFVDFSLSGMPERQRIISRPRHRGR